MKPELRAMVVQAAGGSPYYLERVFLAALHWRGNELWCGPHVIGAVCENSRTGNWRKDCRGTDGGYLEYLRKDEARIALLAAAQEQIRKWFQEQEE